MYVFICSAGHSGSTLLDILLGSHPQGLSLGEITHLPKNIALDSQCSCGRPISSCQFWNPIITGFSEKAGIDFWSRPYALDFGFINASDEIDRRHQTNARMMYRRISYGLQYLSMRYRLPGKSVFRRHSIGAAKNKADFFDYIQTQSGKSFVVDSSKHYLEAINLHSAAPADTKIVLLVRDGRAVFHSGLRRGMSPKSALASWANNVRRADSLFADSLSRGDIISVKYDDIVSSTEQQLERVFDFLGVGMDAYTGPSPVQNRHIVNGNRMRFTENLIISADDKWREQLDSEMLDYFDRHAGELNRAFGYG